MTEDKEEKDGYLVWLSFSLVSIGFLQQVYRVYRTKNVDSFCMYSISLMMLSKLFMLLFSIKNKIDTQVKTYTITTVAFGLYYLLIAHYKLIRQNHR